MLAAASTPLLKRGRRVSSTPVGMPTIAAAVVATSTRNRCSKARCITSLRFSMKNLSRSIVHRFNKRFRFRVVRARELVGRGQYDQATIFEKPYARGERERFA